MQPFKIRYVKLSITIKFNTMNISELKIGDFVKKNGSNIEIKVLEIGYDWRNHYKYVRLYNDVTKIEIELINLKNYKKA